MHVDVHLEVLPSPGARASLLKKMCKTALAVVAVIAFTTAASAQSAPNKPDAGDPTSAFATRSPAPSAPDRTGSAADPPLFYAQLDPAGNPGSEPLAPTTSAGTTPGNSSALSANELAKEISNPVTSLWQLQFQFNNEQLEAGGSNPESGKWVNNLYFQPVLPVSLTNDINLITRPVVTIYQSVPHPTATGISERTTAFGDTVLAQVFSPARTEPWIVAAGPTWIFPTAGSDFAGQGKWQVGPAVGGGYITDKFMLAAFAQQWWSFAGHADRRPTNQMNLLPLAYAFFGDGWSVGYSGNVLADWKARNRDVWTVPLGLSLGKVVHFGQLPVQIQIAGQYFAARPVGGPEWNVQLEITPVIPRLIQDVVFP